MKLAPVKQDNTSDESAYDFIHGKDYIHSTGEIVRFDDTSWCISPVRGKWVTVNFSDLPEWLVRPAKVTTAHGWLTEGASVSALLQRMSAFRRLAEWLRDFKGISIAELSYDHEMILQTHLAGALMQYNDTLEKASLKIGRELSFRESKRVSAESKSLGPKSISSLVSTFNVAARLIEEVDGIAVPIRLQNPRDVNNANSHRMIGSADPNKVLTPEQIAELERA
ncbi:MAG TPA: hypothetical protein VEF04_03725, partial [Blastocatellia bacterium]|nr:hypothetical protein [Blastocatellia bacterium]